MIAHLLLMVLAVLRLRAEAAPATVTVWLVVLAACSGGPSGPGDGPDGDGVGPDATADTGPATASHLTADADGDGYSLLDGDCDDADPTAYPGAPELCDGRDTDCDFIGESDADGDGHWACDDCDDEDPTRHPGAADPVDGVDTDCDGTDGVGIPATTQVIGETPCGELGFSLASLDADGDGVHQVIAGAPLYTDCERDTRPAVLLATPSGIVDELRGGAGEAELGWRVRAYGSTSGDARAAVLIASWQSRGAVQVYDLDISSIGEQPVLSIFGTVEDPISEVGFVGHPARWLAITTRGDPVLGPMQIALFDPLATGELEVGEASMVVDSAVQSGVEGQWVVDVGDRDGDGLSELGVSVAYGLDTDRIGRVHLIQPGIDTVLEAGLESWVGDDVDALTGARVSGGDLDGDGSGELVVSTPYANQDAGEVAVLPWIGSGDHAVADHAVATVHGEFPGDLAMMSAVDDLDGDGVGDLVVGSQASFSSTNAPGKVMLFFGPVQGTLTRADADRVWVGTEPGSRFGYDLATGDFDGDGTVDIVTSAVDQDTDEHFDVGALHFILDAGAP